MSLISRDAYARGAVDWSLLEDGTGLRMSDVDGMTEVNGHFLYLEAKPSGKPMSRGQSLAFERRVLDGRSEVLALWIDDDGRPVFYKLYRTGEVGELTDGWYQVCAIVNGIADEFRHRPVPSDLRAA